MRICWPYKNSHYFRRLKDEYVRHFSLSFNHKTTLLVFAYLKHSKYLLRTRPTSDALLIFGEKWGSSFLAPKDCCRSNSRRVACHQDRDKPMETGSTRFAGNSDPESRKVSELETQTPKKCLRRSNRLENRLLFRSWVPY